MSYKDWYNSLSEDDRGQMRLENEMDRNLSADKKQYERYKSILGKRAGSFRSFVQTKYRDPDAYSVLQSNYKDQKRVNAFQRKIRNGEVNMSIRRDKHWEHQQGTSQWKNRVQNDLKEKGMAQSFFFKDFDYQKAQELINNYTCKGYMYPAKENPEVFKEEVQLDEVIGKVYNVLIGRYEDTKCVKLHYHPKRGTHMYPIKEVKKDG
jgi:hypothetical protein